MKKYIMFMLMMIGAMHNGFAQESSSNSSVITQLMDQIDQLKKENDQLKKENDSLKASQSTGSNAEVKQNEPAKVVVNNSPTDVVSEFDSSESAAVQKYTKIGPTSLSGIVTSFDFEFGGQNGLVILQKGSKHKIAFRYDRDQMHAMQPPTVNGGIDPNTKISMYPKYDPTKLAIMMATEVIDSSVVTNTHGGATNVVKRGATNNIKVLGIGDKLTATVQFDTIKDDGTVVFVVQ